MKKVKKIKRCYNCKYAGDAFSAYYTTHIHCHKPEYEDMYKRGEITSGWETLRVFSSNCDDFVAKEVNK